MQKKKVELKDINLDPRNTRKHDEKNIKVIKESLEKFGQYRPFVIQKEGMIIRVGNGMYQAMQELGIKEADAVIIDLNDDEATALSIIDNRSSELATWDNDLLAECLKDMPDNLLNITGFDSEDLKGILDGLNSDFNENDIQEDEVIEHEFIGENNSIDNETVSPPEEFKECCPKCGYEWSGK
jgi:ParB-like chromosome segregation protein Spo0J